MRINETKLLVAAIGSLMSSMIIASAVPITFSVDMSVYQALGLFNPSGDVVHCYGSFNGWDETFALTNNPSSSNTHVYTGTYDDTSDSVGGTVYYNFLINDGSVYYEHNGRNFVLPSTATNLPTVYYNDEPSTNAYASSQVTFQLNMSIQMALGHFNPSIGDSVVAAGDFNAWSTTATPLTVSSDTNIYTNAVIISWFTNQAVSYSYVIISGTNGPATWESSNRQLYTIDPTQMESAYFNNATTVGPIPVTFRINMGIETAVGTFDPSIGDWVAVFGTPNQWGTSPFLMLTNSPTDSNVYEGTYNDPNGSGAVEQYSFVIDGGANYSGNWEDSGSYPVNAGGLPGNTSRTFTLMPPGVTLPLVYMGFYNLGTLNSGTVSNQQTEITWNVATNNYGYGPAGIYLQTAVTLSGNGSWQAVPGTTNAGTATINIGTSNAFYRLAGPQ